ncbi:MAG: hypothetical protein ABFR50_03260, partial [Candidatus Fermentibacteria bacterium]
MKLPGRTTFLELRCPSPARPFLRLGITLAGFLLWGVFQGFLAGLLDLERSSIPNWALLSFISLIVFFPFWRLVPEVAGRFGWKNGGIAAAASAVLFIPFTV